MGCAPQPGRRHPPRRSGQARASKQSGLRSRALCGADPETHSDFSPWILNVLLLFCFLFSCFSLLSAPGSGRVECSQVGQGPPRHCGGRLRRLLDLGFVFTFSFPSL